MLKYWSVLSLFVFINLFAMKNEADCGKCLTCEAISGESLLCELDAALKSCNSWPKIEYSCNGYKDQICAGARIVLGPNSRSVYFCVFKNKKNGEVTKSFYKRGRSGILVLDSSKRFDSSFAGIIEKAEKELIEKIKRVESPKFDSAQLEREQECELECEKIAV